MTRQEQLLRLLKDGYTEKDIQSIMKITYNNLKGLLHSLKQQGKIIKQTNWEIKDV